jgi:hypothetical protein
MSYVMTSEEFVKRAKKIASEHKTAYMLGTFGWPATVASVNRAIQANSTNAARPAWQSRAKAVIGKGYMFDCVGLIKGILWGWDAKMVQTYGGARYGSNGVPDIGSDYMIKRCPGGGSSDFKNIVPGECVWMTGHIGIYLGDGLVAEATPAWTGGVQISLCTNVVSSKTGYTKKRRWTKHGKLPYIDYSDSVKTAPVSKSVEDQIKEAVESINKAGVKLSADYWVNNYTKLKYLDGLIIKIGSKISGSGDRVNSPITAIDNLVKNGVISSGDYWKANYGKLKYLDEFLCKIGGCKYNK